MAISTKPISQNALEAASTGSEGLMIHPPGERPREAGGQRQEGGGTVTLLMAEDRWQAHLRR
jgi:hypothetical protein